MGTMLPCCLLALSFVIQNWATKMGPVEISKSLIIHHIGIQHSHGTMTPPKYTSYQSIPCSDAAQETLAAVTNGIWKKNRRLGFPRHSASFTSELKAEMWLFFHLNPFARCTTRTRTKITFRHCAKGKKNSTSLEKDKNHKLVCEVAVLVIAKLG